MDDWEPTELALYETVESDPIRTVERMLPPNEPVRFFFTAQIAVNSPPIKDQHQQQQRTTREAMTQRLVVESVVNADGVHSLVLPSSADLAATALERAVETCDCDCDCDEEEMEAVFCEAKRLFVQRGGDALVASAVAPSSVELALRKLEEAAAAAKTLPRQDDDDESSCATVESECESGAETEAEIAANAEEAAAARRAVVRSTLTPEQQMEHEQEQLEQEQHTLLERKKHLRRALRRARQQDRKNVPRRDTAAAGAPEVQTEAEMLGLRSSTTEVTHSAACARSAANATPCDETDAKPWREKVPKHLTVLPAARLPRASTDSPDLSTTTKDDERVYLFLRRTYQSKICWKTQVRATRVVLQHYMGVSQLDKTVEPPLRFPLPPRPEIDATNWTLASSCFAGRFDEEGGFFDAEKRLRKSFASDWALIEAKVGHMWAFRQALSPN